MLQGKTALITGGSRGIGRAIALRMAREGANVAILYAGNEAAAQETVEAARAFGAQAFCARADVGEYAQVESAIHAAKEALGPIHILVNNAGIARDKLIMRMSSEDFAAVVRVNLMGAFHTIRVLTPDFVRQRAGRIINIASVAGLMGNPGQANYASAKAGLIGLTKTVAKELASRGVTCNAIAPGFVETDMTREMNQSALEAAMNAVPLKRMGKPEEIAAAAAFLASDDAAYITGAVLSIDGGLNM